MIPDYAYMLILAMWFPVKWTLFEANKVDILYVIGCYIGFLVLAF